MANAASTRHRIGARLGNVLLTIAAACGAVCIVLVLLAIFFHISLIMFKTDSMSPAIPEGSLAVVREIPASQVKVGEVVTVTRAGQLPISHRVVSVKEAGAGTRDLVLRGDANTVDDPQPYTVSSVRLVVWSVPQLAYFVVWLSNPLVMAGIAIGVALLVTWAFWPSSRARKSGRRRINPTRSTTLLLIVVAAGVGAITTSFSAEPAEAAPVEHTVIGSVIMLTVIGDPIEMADLTPGIPSLWQVGVSTHTTNPGTINLSLLANGQLSAVPAGLNLTVSTCDVRWVGNQCAEGEQSVLAQQPASGLGGASQSLGSMTSAEQRWILVTAVVPAANSVPAGSSTVSITAAGMGDQETTAGTGKSLAYTGTDLWAPIAIAAGSIATGLLLAGAAAIIRRRRETDAA